MAGSHEVRGSIPLGSTKFNSRLKGGFFIATERGTHGANCIRRFANPRLVHLAHRLHHRLHRVGRRPIGHLAVPVSRLTAWRSGLPYPLPVLRSAPRPYRRSRRNVVRPRHGMRPHGRIRQSPRAQGRASRNAHRQSHRHRARPCRARHRHRIHRRFGVVPQVPVRRRNRNLAHPTGHGRILRPDHRRFRKHRLARRGAHHHPCRHDLRHLARHRTPEQGHDAAVLRPILRVARARRHVTGRA